MRKEGESIDISHIPDLLRLVEEVQTSNQPRMLKRGDEEVAMLTPVGPASTTRNSRLLEVFDRVAGSLADVDIPGWESSEAAERWVEELRQADMFPLEPPTNP